MSNLIVFTNRSGSTLLNEILAYNDQSVNLGEGLHSLAREYNYNTEENKQTELYKTFSTSSLTAIHHNVKTRGSDHIGFFKAKQTRMNILKQTNLQWTVKENLEKQTLDTSFVDYCVDNGINVYLTHRRDVVAQFISKINARYRLEIAKMGADNESQFIFTNKDNITKYTEMKIPFHWLHLYLNVFIAQLMLWRVVYERYKHNIKIVSYENEIKPMNFQAIGISNDTVSRYNNEQKHLIPTPMNTDKVIVTDDHPKPIVGAWEQSLYYVERHKHLVEI